MKLNRFLKWIALLMLGLPMILSACSPASSGASATHYTVQITNSQAFIGIAVAGQNVSAYVCDGTDTNVATVSEWFKGTVSSGSFDLTSSGGAHLTGTIGSNGVSGNLTLVNGEDFSFSAAQVGVDAGQFRSEETFNGDKYIAGWIILSDGQQRGALGLDGGGGLGKLAITPIPIPRLPHTLNVKTALGTFNATRVIP